MCRLNVYYVILSNEELFVIVEFNNLSLLLIYYADAVNKFEDSVTYKNVISSPILLDRKVIETEYLILFGNSKLTCFNELEFESKKDLAQSSNSELITNWCLEFAFDIVVLIILKQLYFLHLGYIILIKFIIKVFKDIFNR